MFQMVHLRNNRLAGAAVHTPLVMTAHETIEKFVETMKKEHKPGLLAKIKVTAKALVSAVSRALKKYPWTEKPNSYLKDEVIKYNPQGLTPDGRKAVQRAMDKGDGLSSTCDHLLSRAVLGMPIDVSHVSKKAVMEILDMVRERRC